MRKGNEFKNWLLLLVRLLLLLVSSFAGMVFFAALGVNVYLWALGEGFAFDWGGQLSRAIDIGIKIGGLLAVLMWLGARIPKP